MIYLYILGLLVGLLNIGLGIYKEYKNKKEKENRKKTVFNCVFYIGNGAYLAIVCSLNIYHIA